MGIAGADGEEAAFWRWYAPADAAWSDDGGPSWDASSSPTRGRRAFPTARARTERCGAYECPYRPFSLASLLAMPGGSSWARTGAALALAVPHARCARGVGPPALGASADSTLAVAGSALPVEPTMRPVRHPREARGRQQHHQTSCQTETMHHESLLLAVRLRLPSPPPERFPARGSNSTEGSGASRAGESLRSLDTSLILRVVCPRPESRRLHRIPAQRKRGDCTVPGGSAWSQLPTPPAARTGSPPCTSHRSRRAPPPLPPHPGKSTGPHRGARPP